MARESNFEQAVFELGLDGVAVKRLRQCDRAFERAELSLTTVVRTAIFRRRWARALHGQLVALGFNFQRRRIDAGEFGSQEKRRAVVVEVDGREHARRAAAASKE